MADDPIGIIVGASSEESNTQLEFWQYSEGVVFGGKYNKQDLEIAFVVLKDLADALETSLAKINGDLH